jgi:hypothetical protein
LGDETINGTVTERLRSFGRRLPGFTPGGRRLIAAAAVLHVALAVGLFCAGRAQVTPNLIDRDGIVGTVAVDSYEYQRRAARLVGVLKEGGLAAWAAEREPAHVKLISLQFALLGPFFGHATLSAEPLNLLCYLAVVSLVLALGREVGGPTVGIASAGAVALWPSFLLHTTQFLKDPLFIAAALALILLMTTWVTRDYGWREAAGAVALMAASIGLLLLIRAEFAAVIFALLLLGVALVIVRQVLERRAIYRNLVASLVVLGAGALAAVCAAPDGVRIKQYPSGHGGQPKSVAGAGIKLSASVSQLPPARPKSARLTYAQRLHAEADSAAFGVGSVRYRISAGYPEAGSEIDRDVEIKNFRELALYLPRAVEVGLWAPFPDTWADAGRQVGSAGRLLSGAETCVIYLCELLALAGALRPPGRLAAWLLLLIALFGATALGLVISNVGLLYRLRYTFWVLIIILGVKGFESLASSLHRRGRLRKDG